MKYFLATVIVSSSLGALPVLADNNVAISKAEVAAKSWLTLTDSGKYAQSWDNAASIFKASISKANWETTLKTVRIPFGDLKSRKLNSATFTRSLPGVPDGEYVVIQFTTQFQNKASAIETVTSTHDKDSLWRVAGYFIK
ncbi:hypothetical protein Syn7502_01073 [Synechococcus sp. PCC 7502]|uniref:DUF4019 domain-containing protein n=1 Tax=Synechococcus sp. PCC 7502 TaxID=1173263 RepID=UPI00029FFAD3|nr:DUF4019 domain-containing protein [Synechococcus sp. PCC 7502]AFY73183.1 hypothetical protein Syn7502_01073 [Synechococcus sp. PCC 7502]